MAEQVIDPATNQAVNIEVVNGGPDDPFAPKDSAGTSGAVPQGTPQEPVSPTPEANVEPNPAAPAAPTAPAPAVQPAAPVVVGPPPAPVSPVQVVQTPAAPQPVAQPAQAPVEAAPTKTLEELVSWREDALRTQQSGYDKQAAGLRSSLEQNKGEIDTLTQELREIKLDGLPEEERDAMRKAYEDADRGKNLGAWETELLGFHDDLNVQSLETEYGKYGVTAEMLRACDSPEDMEILARDAQIQYLTANPAPATNVVPTTAPVTAEPVAQVPTPEPAPAVPAAPVAQVPPGAMATPDMGGQGTAPTPKQFNEEASSEAMKDNLGDMGWQTVSVPN